MEMIFFEFCRSYQQFWDPSGQYILMLLNDWIVHVSFQSRCSGCSVAHSRCTFQPIRGEKGSIPNAVIVLSLQLICFLFIDFFFSPLGLLLASFLPSPFSLFSLWSDCLSPAQVSRGKLPSHTGLRGLCEVNSHEKIVSALFCGDFYVAARSAQSKCRKMLKFCISHMTFLQASRLWCEKYIFFNRKYLFSLRLFHR